LKLILNEYEIIETLNGILYADRVGTFLTVRERTAIMQAMEIIANMP